MAEVGSQLGVRNIAAPLRTVAQQDRVLERSGNQGWPSSPSRSRCRREQNRSG
jgi:hypothetical protein